MNQPTRKIFMFLPSSGSLLSPNLTSEKYIQESKFLRWIPLPYSSVSFSASLSLFSINRTLDFDHCYLLLKIITKFIYPPRKQLLIYVGCLLQPSWGNYRSVSS